MTGPKLPTGNIGDKKRVRQEGAIFDYRFGNFLEGLCLAVCRRDLLKIALTVPSRYPVLLAIFHASIPAC
jgi:hypothetical protein